MGHHTGQSYAIMSRKCTEYRPGQPNWEYKMWKVHDFSVTQILREINFGHFDQLSSSEF